MQLHLAQEMLNTVEASDGSKGRQEVVVGGASDYYKKTLSKLTVPYEALTIGEVIGQGTTSILLVEKKRLCLDCFALKTGTFGKVFEGEYSSGDSKTNVAVKTIKSK